MLTTIKGIYINGEITLEEKPEATQPMEVLVTFTKEVSLSNKNPMDFGYGKGMSKYLSQDFDEPYHDVKDYMY